MRETFYPVIIFNDFLALIEYVHLPRCWDRDKSIYSADAPGKSY